MNKEYIGLQKWTDDYEGAAIYSLVDQRGKRYVGQALHLQKRLETHRKELNRVVLQPTYTESPEGQKLVQAVRNGSRFRVEILKRIPWNEATANNLRYWEYYYLELFGGLEKTYNAGVIPSPVWEYEAFNNIELCIDLTDADILEHLNSKPNKQGYIKALIRQDMKKPVE